MRVDSVQAVVTELPLDSIETVRGILKEAKDDILWMGADTTIQFVREDAMIINDVSKASRWLKDALSRITGMAKEADRCRSQINGLISVIESEATIDAQGDTIDADYIAENVKREIEAVEKLVNYLNESEKYINLGLECQKNSWDAIDSLLGAKRAMWARAIAGENSNLEEK